MSKARILVIEDDEPIRRGMVDALGFDGYETLEAADGHTGMKAAVQGGYDLLLLDLIMPGPGGLDILAEVKLSRPTMPVIILSAKGEEADRVRGLKVGADDYVVKPFSPAELIARVRAVLRRAEPGLSEDKLAYGGIEMDLSAHKVTRGGRSVHLGPTEYRLLQVLMERPTRVFSREQLLDKAWGRDIYVEERTVDVHIRRLRRALNADDAPDLIRTVRRGGYAIDIDAP
jgi:two-component system phosphate regulon response regulator PhoB